jgi:hypothetical protein
MADRYRVIIYKGGKMGVSGTFSSRGLAEADARYRKRQGYTTKIVKVGRG